MAGALTSDADILFYGCDLASDPNGQTFLQSVGTLTGADVAASTDDTGHANYGGDWDLEYATGSIETEIAFSLTVQQDWVGKLATITVTTFADEVSANGFTSLREAIIATNAGSGGDTILLSAGSYTLAITGTGENAAATGDLDILESVTIVGQGAGSTIIDGAGIDRVFQVRGASHLEISDLSIQGGSTSESGGGIAIHDSGSSVTADHIIVLNNFAAKGAGIANSGTLILTDVSINDNGTTAGTSEGGGLHNKRNATLDRVTISDNSAQRGGRCDQLLGQTGLERSHSTGRKSRCLDAPPRRTAATRWRLTQRS